MKQSCSRTQAEIQCCCRNGRGKAIYFWGRAGNSLRPGSYTNKEQRSATAGGGARNSHPRPSTETRQVWLPQRRGEGMLKQTNKNSNKKPKSHLWDPGTQLAQDWSWTRTKENFHAPTCSPSCNKKEHTTPGRRVRAWKETPVETQACTNGSPQTKGRLRTQKNLTQLLH